jgi:hypothetical protein
MVSILTVLSRPDGVVPRPGYFLLSIGVHCAEAIFHLPASRKNTTVVASCEVSSADLDVTTPVKIAVSPYRRTAVELKAYSVAECAFCCSPALGLVLFQTSPVGMIRTSFCTSI